MAERIIFHVDANSAFLSWSAVYRLKVLGETVDLRDVPSVVAGDKASRHSIILAKKRTGEKIRYSHRRTTFSSTGKVSGVGRCSPGLSYVCGSLPAFCCHSQTV